MSYPMKFTLRRADREPNDVHGSVQVTVATPDAAVEAAWTWCRYTGGGEVTAYEENGDPFCKVSYEILEPSS